MEEQLLLQKQNVRWVRYYAKWLTILGCFVIIIGLVYSAIGCVKGFHEYSSIRPIALIVQTIFGVITSFAFGFILIGIGQLLGYIFGTRQRMSWLLRYGDKGLYFLAIVWVSQSVFMSISYLSGMEWWFYIVVMVMPVTKAFVMVTLGLILRKVLPMVEEFRTMV